MAQRLLPRAIAQHSLGSTRHGNTQRMNALTIRERLGEAARFFANLDAALFTTFNFNPDFFEQNVLPTALGVEAPNVAAARPVVHARLCEVPVIVFYDPSIQVQPGGVFQYTSCPIAVKGAFFHPKNVILAGIDEENTSW